MAVKKRKILKLSLIWKEVFCSTFEDFNLNKTVCLVMDPIRAKEN